MSKLSTLLISSFFLHFTAFSQIEITEITPNIGDQLSYGETEVESFDPGPSGADVVWDFSSFIGSSSMIADYQILSAEGQNGAENFPENSTLWKVNFSDTAELNFYFGPSGNAWIEHGYYNIIQANAALKLNTDPEISYTAPLNYQNTGSDSYEGTLSFDGTLVFNYSGNVTFEVDGWGELIMPNVTYSNALRVKTIENEDQVIAGLTLNSITTNYTFYVEEYPVPVLNISISESYFNGNLTDMTTTVTPLLSYNGLLGIDKPIDHIELTMFPNPASDYITFDFDSEKMVDLRIINARGKMVSSQQISRNTKVNVGELPAGIYIAQMLLDGSYFSKARFIIAR